LSFPLLCHLSSLTVASHIEGSNEANCLSAGQLGEIMRDIGRTFPQHPIFTHDGPGELMLANILKAIVSLRPDIGYCQVPSTPPLRPPHCLQGMNFVVGALLLGRLASNPEIFEQLCRSADLSEESLPSQQRYQMESDIFWATQVTLPSSLPSCPSHPPSLLSVCLQIVETEWSETLASSTWSPSGAQGSQR
jgi:hypothetical protein